MNTIDKLLSALKVSAKIFHNGQYCGNWQADTSGSGYMNFHIITHGHCYFHTNAGETHRLEKGDMVLMPTDSGHYLSPVANDTPTGNTNNSKPVPASLTSEDPVLVCGYFVHQHPFAKILNQGLPEYLVVKKRNKAQHGMYPSMQLLMSESLNKHDSVQVNSVVLDKIAELIFVYVAKDMFSDNSALFSAMTHPKLSSSIQAMHDNPSHKWSVDELSQYAFMSRSAYASLFKSITGLAPLQYLTQWRCSCALQDLTKGNASMVAIANRYGYDSEASFSKAFKRVTGQSPGALRNTALTM